MKRLAIADLIELQLVEAKLRRAYQEGQAARLAGPDPLAAELAATIHRSRSPAATPALPMPTVPEDGHNPPVHPNPTPQSPPRPAVSLTQHGGDVRHAGAGLTREGERSIAQADANMAALLQEEAG